MMRSAIAFLPDSMITFMNLERSTEPNFGSGRISRLGTSRRRGMGVFLLSVSVGADVSFCASKGHQDPSLTRPAKLASRSTQTLEGACLSRKPSGLLGTFCAVLRARLLAVLDALQVERTAHDVV